MAKDIDVAWAAGIWRGHDLSDPQHLYVHKKTAKRHCRTCRDARRKGCLPRLAT